MRDTIDMAREAGIIDFRDAYSEQHVQAVLQDLKGFEVLVRADERESIKTICKEEQTEDAADLWNVCCTHIINKINEVKA
jgi:ribosomal protein S19E (S16A)